MSRYRNRKSGELYVVLHRATDCTNAREGTPVVVYARKGDVTRIFTRDAEEFDRKFEIVRPPYEP